MRATYILSVLATLAEALPERRAAKPFAFYLAGDSTTAIQIAANGGGWGNGFLKTLANGATGINYGHNGATTASFVSGGDWATVLGKVRNATANYSPYVTISFGHNDQKNTSGVSVAQYTANLQKMGTDVRTAGGTPLFVTSVSRRNYDANNQIIEDLAPQVAAMKVAAANISADVLDLNALSTTYLNAIGPADGHQYNLTPDDNTHISASGSILFGTMVATLMYRLPTGAYYHPWVKINQTILADFKAGIFILPTV